MIPLFYQSAYSFDQSVWDLKTGLALAGTVVDQRIHRHKGYYLEADIRRLWASWFIEGIFDPYLIIERNPKALLLDIMKEVDDELSPTFNNPLNIAWPEIRQAISVALLEKVNKIKIGYNRKNFSESQKRILLAQDAPRPHCWICGDAFSQQAIDIFLKDSDTPLPTPLYIDIFRPKGLNWRHLRIEIDHIFPVAKGGIHDITNFRLCCGWCNIYKKDLTSLYEAKGVPKRLKKGNITQTTKFRTIPQFFWSVRALGLTQKCEHEDCLAQTKTEPLFISLICPNGSATPSNLKVTCKQHDPFKLDRYQPVKDVEHALEK